MPRRVVPLIAAVLLASGCASTLPGRGAARPRPAAVCRPAFVGVPGSGQGVRFARPTSAPPGVSLANAYRFGSTLGLVEAHLRRLAGPGLGSSVAVDYPAVSVEDYTSKDGLTARLGPSEAAGIRAVRADLDRLWAGGCVARPVLLAGYSQGAEVAARTAAALPAAQRARLTLALLGNPSYRPGRVGDVPGHTGASGIRPTFQDGRAYAPPADLAARTTDVCAPGDSVCNVRAHAWGWLGRLVYVYRHTAAHHSYAEDRTGYARWAATFLWWHRR